MSVAVAATDEATETSGEEADGCDEKVVNSRVAGIRQTFPMLLLWFVS